jgi:hypothetical protein
MTATAITPTAATAVTRTTDTTAGRPLHTPRSI